MHMANEMVNVTLAMAAEVGDSDLALLDTEPRGWSDVNREEMLLSWEEHKFIDSLRAGYGQRLLKGKSMSEAVDRKGRRDPSFVNLLAESTTPFPLVYTGPTRLHSIPVFMVNESSHDGTVTVLDG